MLPPGSNTRNGVSSIRYPADAPKGSVFTANGAELTPEKQDRSLCPEPGVRGWDKKFPHRHINTLGYHSFVVSKDPYAPGIAPEPIHGVNVPPRPEQEYPPPPPPGREIPGVTGLVKMSPAAAKSTPRVAVQSYVPRMVEDLPPPRPAEKAPSRGTMGIDLKVRRSLGQYGVGEDGAQRRRIDEVFGENKMNPAWDRLDRYRSDFAKATPPGSSAGMRKLHASHPAPSGTSSVLSGHNEILSGLRDKLKLQPPPTNPDGARGGLKRVASRDNRDKSTKDGVPIISPRGAGRDCSPHRRNAITGSAASFPPPLRHSDSTNAQPPPKSTEDRAAQRMYVGQHPGGLPMERSTSYKLGGSMPKEREGDAPDNESVHSRHRTRTLIPMRTSKDSAQGPKTPPGLAGRTKYEAMLRPSTADLMKAAPESAAHSEGATARQAGTDGVSDVTPMPRHGMHFSAGGQVPNLDRHGYVARNQGKPVYLNGSRDDHPDLGGEDKTHPGAVHAAARFNKPSYALPGKRPAALKTDGSPPPRASKSASSPTKTKRSSKSASSPTKKSSMSPAKRSTSRASETVQGWDQERAWDPDATTSSRDAPAAGVRTEYGNGTLGSRSIRRQLASPLHDTADLEHEKKLPRTSTLPHPRTPPQPVSSPGSRLLKASLSELPRANNVNMANPLSVRHRITPTPNLVKAMSTMTSDQPSGPLVASLARSLPGAQSQALDETRPRTPSKAVVSRPKHPRNYITPPGSNQTASRMMAPAYPGSRGHDVFGRPTTGGVKHIKPGSTDSRPGTASVFSHAPAAGHDYGSGSVAGTSQVLNVASGDEFELTELPDLLAMLGDGEGVSSAPSEVANLHSVYSTLADVLVASARKGVLDAEYTTHLTQRMKEFATKLKQCSDTAKTLSLLRSVARAEGVPVKNWIAHAASSAGGDSKASAVMAVELEEKTSDLVHEQVETCRALARQVKAGLESVLKAGCDAGTLASPDEVPSALEVLEPELQDSDPDCEPAWLTSDEPVLHGAQHAWNLGGADVSRNMQ